MPAARKRLTCPLQVPSGQASRKCRRADTSVLRATVEAIPKERGFAIYEERSARRVSKTIGTAHRWLH